MKSNSPFGQVQVERDVSVAMRDGITLSTDLYFSGAANPNTGERVNSHTHTVIARNRIYHDSTHPSHLVLPVIGVHS